MHVEMLYAKIMIIIMTSSYKAHFRNEITLNMNVAQNIIYIIIGKEIDLMHMTSQKGAQARWGSNVALPHAPSGRRKYLWPRVQTELRLTSAINYLYLPAQHVRAARQV